VAKINEKGSGHGNKTDGEFRYWEYSNETALKILKRAIFILDHNLKGFRPCNDCFQKLPGGRTFDEVWADTSVWINFDPREPGWYGNAMIGGKELSLTMEAFKRGRWWVAGTLVHELAHINGAPTTTTDADDVLLCCGLKGAWEGVIGMRTVDGSTRLA
jgi:hypothetical protein